MEVERLRVAKFYHYYHSKMGMWGTRNMFNANDRDMLDEFDGDKDIIKLYNETAEKEKRHYSRRYYWDERNSLVHLLQKNSHS